MMKSVVLADRILQLSIGLLVMLPLGRLDSLSWWEYLRLWLIVAGLAYLLRQRLWHPGADGNQLGGLILAPAFIFVVLQFGGDPLESHFSLWLVSILSLASFAALVYGGFGGLPDRLDWAVLAVALLLISGSVGASTDAGQGSSWTALPRFGALALLWFAVRRGVRRTPETGRRLGVALVGVLAIVSLLGIFRFSSVSYYRMRGGRARAAGELDAATGHLERSLETARRLGLSGTADRLTFSLASIMHARGQEREAAALLGLAPDFSALVVPADSWDGPEGGQLFNIRSSCWKDILFYPGEAELRIYASGDPALGIWPLMQVKLDGRVLGEVFVSSREEQAYPFPITTHRQVRWRLQITFLNDYFDSQQRLDRNLWIKDAEIHYRQIFWE